MHRKDFLLYFLLSFIILRCLLINIGWLIVCITELLWFLISWWQFFKDWC